jgi:hypothetical protein
MSIDDERVMDNARVDGVLARRFGVPLPVEKRREAEPGSAPAPVSDREITDAVIDRLFPHAAR